MMAVRLLELRGVLKPTGSLYVHCDDMADAYLRMLCDAVLGAGSFRNAITWRRTTAHSDGGRFGRNADTLLFYTQSRSATWNDQFTPYAPEYRKRFRYRDPDGRLWQDGNLSAKGLLGGGYPGFPGQLLSEESRSGACAGHDLRRSRHPGRRRRNERVRPNGPGRDRRPRSNTRGSAGVLQTGHPRDGETPPGSDPTRGKRAPGRTAREGT